MSVVAHCHSCSLSLSIVLRSFPRSFPCSFPCPVENSEKSKKSRSAFFTVFCFLTSRDCTGILRRLPPSRAHTRLGEREEAAAAAKRPYGYTATRLHGHAGQPCWPVQRECLSVVSNVVEFASLRICRITTQITRIPTYRHCVESCISIASHILVQAGSHLLVQAGSHVLMQTSDGI